MSFSVAISVRNGEMEASFGTKDNPYIRPLSKIDYNNVITKLLSNGWTCVNPNAYDMLRISVLDGARRYPYRFEINSLDYISKYCKTNNITSNDVQIIKKQLYQKSRFTKDTTKNQDFYEKPHWGNFC